MTDIPNIFHFVFGLRPQTEPMHIVHYLCLESCRRVYRPDAIHLHYRHLPHGPLWERIRPYLTLHPVPDDASVLDPARYRDTAEGRYIEQAGWQYAHEADVIRLQALLEHGGIYADMDTMFVQPVPEALYRHEFVMGEEPPMPGPDGILKPSLCNAVMMARPGARFIRTWLRGMSEAFDGTWSRHSCQEAARLWFSMPKTVHVAPQRYFYRHPPTREGLRGLFEWVDLDLNDIYSMHLWAHLWWDAWRTDFTTFHAGLIDEAFIREVDTTYNLIARGFLD